ncbi:MAG: methionyl-tRNA formyltransferase [candidate division WOR-3 bacterium]
MRIIFFGSTEFSLPIVQEINKEFTLLGVVVTKPRPKGRGLKIMTPPVGVWAESMGISVYAPESPDEASFINLIRELKSDLFVLSAYGHILSNELLKIPRLGGINIHPSLLPKYRGAAPIQRALMNGEKKTGITIFFMDEKVDHGKLIMQKEVEIGPDENFGALSRRLSLIAAQEINGVIRNIATGNYTLIEQCEEEKSYAPKIKKEETIIDWNNSTEKIFNLIRALSPQPGARTRFRGQELIILNASMSDIKIAPGTIHIEDHKLYVGTGNGSIILNEVKPQNRKAISGRDFLNGFRIKEGERLSYECA